MIKKQKTFVQSLEGWTSGPLDKCFLLKEEKEEKEEKDKCYVFFKFKCDFFKFKCDFFKFKCDFFKFKCDFFKSK